MKLRGIYYLSDPKDVENDYIDVRILTNLEDNELGGSEYTMQATTPKYIAQAMKEKGCFYSNLPLLVVKCLEDEIIIKTIKELLPNIDKIAFRIE